MNTKIDIVTGFLGAGKTTLIQKLLGESFFGEKIAIVENEFGEVGIDGAAFSGEELKVEEINSGCICCSLTGDFEKALEKIISSYNVERIIVEPSGVAKLSDVLKAVTPFCQKKGLELSSAMTVVDVSRFFMYMENFEEFFTDQISKGDLIVLSRTGETDKSEIIKVLKEIEKLNEDVPVITAPWDTLHSDAILECLGTDTRLAFFEGLIEEDEEGEDNHHHHDHDCSCGDDHDHGNGCGCGEDHDHGHECGCGEDHNHGHECGCGEDHNHGHECGCGEDHHHHDHEHNAEEVFRALSFETPFSFSRSSLDALLGRLSSGEFGTVLRGKGVIPLEEGGWIQFNFVPGELSFVESRGSHTGRLCFIGTDLNSDLFEEHFGGH
jgi:G3E family GTPase